MSRLYQTTDYRQAIVTELEERKLLRRDLARALDMSEAWISRMLKRAIQLDPELVPCISVFFSFNPDEEGYFAALVDLENRSPKAKEAARATVRAVQRQQGSEAPTEDWADVMGTWYIQTIAELAHCEGFRPDPAWIAGTLQPPITVEQAQEALELLVRIGILVRDEQGGLRSSLENWTPSDLPRGAVSHSFARFHTDALDLAKEALWDTRPNERHYSAIIFAIPEESYAKLAADLRELERRLALAAAEAQASGTANRVYILSTHLFPVSVYTDSDSEENGAESKS